MLTKGLFFNCDLLLENAPDYTAGCVLSGDSGYFQLHISSSAGAGVSVVLGQSRGLEEHSAGMGLPGAGRGGAGRGVAKLLNAGEWFGNGGLSFKTPLSRSFRKLFRSFQCCRQGAQQELWITTTQEFFWFLCHSIFPIKPQGS